MAADRDTHAAMRASWRAFTTLCAAAAARAASSSVTSYAERSTRRIARAPIAYPAHDHARHSHGAIAGDTGMLHPGGARHGDTPEHDPPTAAPQ